MSTALPIRHCCSKEHPWPHRLATNRRSIRFGFVFLGLGAVGPLPRKSLEEPHVGATIGVLLRKRAADKVLARIGAFRAKGRIVQTSPSHEAEDRLRAALEPVAVLGLSSDQVGGGKG